MITRLRIQIHRSRLGIHRAGADPKTNCDRRRLYARDGPGETRVASVLGRNKDWLAWVALCVILLVGLAARLFLRSGLENPDSFAYLVSAIKLGRVGLRSYLAGLSNIYENRISIVLPLSLILQVFGYSETTFTLLPLLYSLLTTLATFGLGKLTNGRTALLAAAIGAFIPQDVYLSTAILPDSVLPFYTTASLFCFALGQKRNSAVLHVLSGFFLFCAFEARATGAIFVAVLVLVAWWSSPRRWTAVVLPTISFLGLVAVFWALLHLLSGDFWLQLGLFVADATAEKYVGTGEPLWYLRETVGMFGLRFGLLYHLAFPALILGFCRAPHRKQLLLPTIAFALPYVFLEFGSTSLTSYQPVWKMHRFLTMLSAPAALLIAASTDHIFFACTSRRWLKRIVFGLLAAHLYFSILFPVFFGPHNSQAVIEYNHVYKQVFKQLAAYQPKTIGVVNFRWSLRGQVYAHLNGQTYTYLLLEGVPLESLRPGTVVIFDPMFFTPYGEYHLDRSEFPALRDLPEQIPPGWRLLFVQERVCVDGWSAYVYLVEE